MPARQNALALVPTTAGTGSEAGIRALVTDVATGMKVAVESPHLLADMVAMDPDLTMTLPPAVTAATGIDAMAHCVEAFTSRKSHPLIDSYALMGIELVARYLPRAVADGADAEARAGLLLAAYYGGICLGPVNTAAGHALAYPLGHAAEAAAWPGQCDHLSACSGLQRASGAGEDGDSRRASGPGCGRPAGGGKRVVRATGCRRCGCRTTARPRPNCPAGRPRRMPSAA